MIFAQMLEIVALSDLASVLCAREFSFAPQGVDWKLPPFHFHLLLFYYLFIIIGSPDVFRLRKEPINSLSYVRPSVSAFRPYSLDRSIFFSNFLHEVVSPYDFDDRQKFFRSKNFLTPKMAKNSQNLAIFGQNSYFWVFWPISSIRRYNFL